MWVSRLLCRTNVTNIKRAAVARTCPCGSYLLQNDKTFSNVFTSMGGLCVVGILLLIEIERTNRPQLSDSNGSTSIPALLRQFVRVDSRDRTVFCVLKFLARNTMKDTTRASFRCMQSMSSLSARPAYSRTTYVCCLLVAGLYAFRSQAWADAP